LIGHTANDVITVNTNNKIEIVLFMIFFLYLLFVQ